MNHSQNSKTKRQKDREMVYQLEGRPGLSTAVPLGLQHVLAMFTSAGSSNGRGCRYECKGSTHYNRKIGSDLTVFSKLNGIQLNKSCQSRNKH